MGYIITCSGNREKYFTGDKKEFWSNDLNKVCIFEDKEGTIDIVNHPLLDQQIVDETTSVGNVSILYPHPIIEKAVKNSEHSYCTLYVKEIIEGVINNEIIFEKAFNAKTVVTIDGEDCTKDFERWKNNQ